MTSWERHHPPHDHPDLTAYFDTLTDDDLAAMNTATVKINDGAGDTQDDF